jgi:CubicO group peptidase (beta-lactamase class C family)
MTACGTLSERAVDSTDFEAQRYAISGDLRKEVELLAQPMVDQGVTPGIVVGVLLPAADKSLQMQFFSFGVTDKDSGATPNADTIFATGSLSKGFLGVITASLVKEGVLSWDDTLDKLLPPGTALSADAKKISLLQLATHTSGLPRQPMDVETLAYFLKFLFTGENFYHRLDQGGAVAYLADFKAPKTSEPQYSNLGYAILGRAIEIRTGQSLDALLNKYLLQPLELKNTGYALEALPGRLNRAHGHAGDQPKFIQRGQHVPDWKWVELMKGSSGIYSNARDLLTYASAHMDANGANSKSAFIDTLRVRFERPKEAAGVAWLVDEFDGQRISYQVGYMAGYSSYIGLDVDRKMAVVVLQNTFNWTDSVGHKLLIRMARAKKITDRVTLISAAGDAGHILPNKQH